MEGSIVNRVQNVWEGDIGGKFERHGKEWK
jgi:hypothetical protein